MAGVLSRRSAIFVQTIVAVFIIGLIQALVTQPVYRSTTRLRVAPNLFAAAKRALDDRLTIANAYQAAGLRVADPRVKTIIDNDTDPGVIDVSVEAFSPTVAADVANNLSQSYVDQNGAAAGRVGAATVIGRAGVNPTPIRPNRPLIVVRAICLGVVVGLFFAVLQDRLSRKL